MSMPPPPPPGGSEPPYAPGPPGSGFPPAPTPPLYPGAPPPPPGYQSFGYGMQPVEQKTNGLSIASFVLSLVTVIPCFWFFPITAVLGTIFGFVSRGQLRQNPGQRGGGLATAGIVIGLFFIVAAIAWWIWLANTNDCYRDGSTFRCNFND